MKKPPYHEIINIKEERKEQYLQVCCAAEQICSLP